MYTGKRGFCASTLFNVPLPLSPVSPTATHSQIMLLHSLKKANYQLPLLITDSGVPPLSNSTEVKVQVCVCKKNKMHCSSAHSHRVSLLMLLATLPLALLCKYHHHCNMETMRCWTDALFTDILVNSWGFFYTDIALVCFVYLMFLPLFFWPPCLRHPPGSQTWICSEYLI